MMIPKAFISHCSPGRLRIRIPAKRGDEAYFATLCQELAALESVDSLSNRSISGSLLLVGDGLDQEAIARHAKESGHFILQQGHGPIAIPLAKRLGASLKRLDGAIHRHTDGQLDLPGAFFISLLGFGIWELLRGNFRTPPWYTAFWYAFGVFSKAMVDGVETDAVGDE